MFVEIKLNLQLYLYFLLEDDYTPSLVSCGQQLPCVVELNSRYDVRWKKNKNVTDI